MAGVTMNAIMYAADNAGHAQGKETNSQQRKARQWHGIFALCGTCTAADCLQSQALTVVLPIQQLMGNLSASCKTSACFQGICSTQNHQQLHAHCLIAKAAATCAGIILARVRR